MGLQDLSGRSMTLPPTPRPAHGDLIVERAETTLRHNSYLSLKNVHCDFREGVLILRGCLPTYYLKQMAQSVVARMDGVLHILNEIEVVGSHRR